MFIGHFAVALAAKKATPKMSLGTLFIACQLLDLICPMAIFLGLERAAFNRTLPTFNALDLIDVPFSHSLGMALIWSSLFGVFINIRMKSYRFAFIAALVVFSHWILDFMTHVPDLPLWFGRAKVGLGLWKSARATFLVETGMFGLGIYLYCQAAFPFSRRKRIVFSSMILFLFVFYLAHVFGPRPPDTNSPYVVAGPAFALWLIVFWAYRADRA